MNMDPGKLYDEVRHRVSEEAIALTEDAFVWDMTLPWVPGYADEYTLQRFHRAGVNAISLTVGGGGDHETAPLIKWIAEVRCFIADRPEEMVLCRSVEEMERARSENKIALVLNFQETRPFQNDLNLISLYYDLGVRHALLAYNARNAVGDGCAERTDSGLSRWGIQVIEEMNRVGMLVCGTHSGYRTTMDAIEVTKAPFIFSHSNAYSVHQHYRNIRDDQIKACANTGGVVGVNGLGEFLDDHEATSQSMFKHIDYIANLVGPEHVGIGLDYVRDVAGFWNTWVVGNTHMWPENAGSVRTFSKFAQPEQIFELTNLMLRHNYRESEIRGILGHNFKRVAAEVWK
jgi:membrane dipeptidase